MKTRRSPRAVLLVCSLGLFAGVTSIAWFADSSAADKVQPIQVGNQAKQVLVSTAELRTLIAERTSEFRPSDFERHNQTAYAIARSFITLGQVEAVADLRDRLGNDNGKNATRMRKAFNRMLRDAGGLVLSDQDNNSRVKLQIVLGLIGAGRLEEAERSLVKIMDERFEKKFDTLAALIGNADLAVVAHWQGEEDRVLAALQRYRCLCEGSQEVSERPLDQEIDWLLKADEQRANYFVKALASCGRAELVEELWGPLSRAREETSSWANFAAENICIRLVEAGQQDAAIRFANTESGTDQLSLELLEALAVQAVEDDDLPTAKKWIDQHIEALNTPSFKLAREHQLTDQAKKISRLSLAANAYRSLISKLKTTNHRELAVPVARSFIQATFRFNDEFENRSTIADINQMRSLNPKFYRFNLETIVGILPEDEVREFANRQFEFFRRTKDHLRVSGPFANDPFRSYELDLASLGSDPGNPFSYNLKERFEFAERLLEAGNREAADKMYNSILKTLETTKSLTYVSGSLAGRVVNGSVQLKYQAADLSPRFGRLDAGIKTVDMIEHLGSRIDGYRVIARAHSKEVGAAKALDWARQLENPDYQLAAFVGILEAEVSRITEPAVGPETIAERLHRLGRPLAFLLRC